MDVSRLNYLPLPLPFFSIFAGLFLLLAALLFVGVLRYAYLRLGISPLAAMLVLLASLFGSYLNIPVAQLPARQVLSGQEIAFFGMHYVVPVVVDWPGTVIAVNVGGALVPAALSLYLFIKSRVWLRMIVATAVVAAIIHGLAHPVPGLGIAIPTFVPPAVTAVVSVLLSRSKAAVIAYVSGSVGTLIGADLLNLDKVQGLGAPVASIGGAGTFDGIFLTGILAVVLASIPTAMEPPRTAL
ncbi:MAG TPA: DUF1614 domain-containing protein [Stellaceae bacterium]|jgi:uncharacterized membrane protein|nr:DUF1614 domain-containing protein [Stellaceae bacterium]